MKMIFNILVGIATLFAGAITNVATADDHRYQYIVSGIHIGKHQIVRIMGTSGQATTVEIKVLDDHGANVGSDTTRTLQPNNMRRILAGTTAITGTSTSTRPFRTVFITANEKLWVHAMRGVFPDQRSMVTLPVFEKVLPTTPEKDDDSCPDGAKTC